MTIFDAVQNLNDEEFKKLLNDQKAIQDEIDNDFPALKLALKRLYQNFEARDYIYARDIVKHLDTTQLPEEVKKDFEFFYQAVTAPKSSEIQDTLNKLKVKYNKKISQITSYIGDAADYSQTSPKETNYLFCFSRQYNDPFNEPFPEAATQKTSLITKICKKLTCS